MLMTWIVFLMTAVLLYLGIKIYKGTDWGEPADPSPDLRQMHRKEAELVHFQDLLAEAQREGKISANAVQEFSRYCENEIARMHAAETAWKERPRTKGP